jgi:hypothetical protein
MVPEATAYAGYAISGSSRELAVGPSASVVALSASAVGAVAVAKARRRPGEPGSIIAIPHPRRSRSSQPRTWCTIRLPTKRCCTAFSPARGRPAAAAPASPRASRRCPARHRSPSPPAQGARPGLAGRPSRFVLPAFATVLAPAGPTVHAACDYHGNDGCNDPPVTPGCKRHVRLRTRRRPRWRPARLDRNAPASRQLAQGVAHRPLPRKRPGHHTAHTGPL